MEDLRSYLTLRERCPPSSVLDLSGFVDVVCDEDAVAIVLPLFHSGLRSVSLATTRLGPALFCQLVEGLAACSRLKSLSLAFFSLEPASEELNHAIARLLARLPELERLELVIESVGFSALVLESVGRLSLLQHLVLITQFFASGLDALPNLPTGLKTLWLGTCILGEAPEKLLPALQAVLASQTGLESLSLTLCPTGPETETFVRGLGEAVGLLPVLKSFTYFGGVGSLAETKMLLQPSVLSGRVAQCMLCTRYFQLEAICTPGANLRNLTSLTLVLGKHLDPEQLDVILAGARALETLVLDCERSSSPNLLTPERVSKLAALSSLTALMLRVRTDIHALAYALERFPSLVRLQLGMHAWEEADTPFSLPPSLRELWLDDCVQSSALQAAQGVEQLSKLCVAMRSDDYPPEGLAWLRARLSWSCELSLVVDTVDDAVSVAAALSGAVAVIRIDLGCKIKTKHLPKLELAIEASNRQGTVLLLDRFRSGGYIEDVVLFAGYQISPVFQTLLSAIRDVPVGEVQRGGKNRT